MAASRPVKYDVFISHRGPDTKKNFAILLKAALQKQRIVAFHDDRDLVPGHAAPAGLQAAMEDAELGIVILSPGFFESRYCMEELNFFLHAGHVLPVLVDLTPDLCKAESVVERVGRAWETCKMGEMEWRDILRRSQGITMHVAYDGYWDRCLDEVVRLTAQALGRPAPSTGPRVNMVPYKQNVHFLGRDDELEKMRAVLGGKNRVCISGMGGMGKTQLALEYVYRNELQYASILWVNAEAGVIGENYLKLAKRLGIAVGEGPADDQVASIRSHLEEAMEGPYLLVFDNVEDEADFAAYYEPRRGPCHVIVTTRLDGMEQLTELKIGALQKQDALRLARGARSFDEQEEMHLKELAVRFGDLTLALAVSSRLFNDGSGFYPSRLLKDLDRKGPRIFARKPADPVFRKHPDLVRLFETSFERLLLDAQANDAEKLLAHRMAWVGGWFAPAPIREDLLAAAACGLAGIEDGPKSKERSEANVGQATADSAAADEDQIREGVRLLKRFALADEIISESKIPQLSFHALVQNFCRMKGGRNAGVAMAKALTQLGRVKEEKDHFTNAFELVRFQQEPEAPPREILLELEDEAAFIMSVGMPLFAENGLFRSQFEEAQRIHKRCLNGLHAGLVLMKARAESVEIQQKIVAASSPEAEPRRKEAAESLKRALAGGNAILQALQTSGLLQKSELEPSDSKALEVAEQEVGLHDRAGMMSLRGHRAMKLQIEGRLGEAEELFRKIMEDEVEERGPCQPEVATALQNLAVNLRFQGRDAEAEPMYRRVWEIRTEALGPEDPQTTTSMINLAFVVHARGRHAEAETLFREALEVNEKVGAQHEETARAANFLARQLIIEGRYNEAERFAKQALEIMERGLGVDHPDVVEYRDLYNNPRLAPYHRPAATPTTAPSSTSSQLQPTNRTPLEDRLQPPPTSQPSLAALLGFFQLGFSPTATPVPATVTSPPAPALGPVPSEALPAPAGSQTIDSGMTQTPAPTINPVATSAPVPNTTRPVSGPGRGSTPGSVAMIAAALLPLAAVLCFKKRGSGRSSNI